MKIAYETELMQNQTHADVMAPDQRFEVLQTDDGFSLFFSIGTDGVLYLTQEAAGAATGWTRLDLSSALAQQHGGGAVTAKAFDVSQNAQTNAIDLVLAVTVGGTDFLYLSRGNANTDASWAAGVAWTAVPFDAAGETMPVLSIADVYVLQAPGAEDFVVDVMEKPGDPLKLIGRYYVTPGATPAWNRHDLPVSLSAGTVSSALGKRPGDYVAGIYTFGAINGAQELIYVPLYNAFDPGRAPDAARLAVPSTSTAFAVAVDGAGFSTVFVAADGALSVFVPDDQKDGATGVQIAAAPVLAGVQGLQAATQGSRTAVWGVNQQGDLFYLACPAGSEGSAAAWSSPMPLLPGVETASSFLNGTRGNSVIFAHTQGQTVVQLTQDPVTTEWQQRSILLPSTDPDDLVSYDSFTTHLKVTSDDNAGASLAALNLTASSPVSVYVNGVYHVLSPTVPVAVNADATGSLTVVQETHALGAVCLHAALVDGSAAADVNPMAKILGTLATVQTGDQLAAVQVTNADGTQQPLVPAGATADQRDAAAQSLQQFVKIAGTLPQNGTRQSAPAPSATAPADMLAAAAPTAEAAPHVWGMAFGDTGWTYHEGDDAVECFGLGGRGGVMAMSVETAALSDVGSAIRAAAGDVFQWLKSAYDSVTHFFVQAANGVYDFFIQVGEDLYHLVLDTVNTVLHAVELVFNKIKVFFEDLIKWLGFLFQWGDVLRTHNVIKNLFRQYAAKAVAGLGTLEADLKNVFTGLESKVDAWAGIPDDPTPIGTHQASSAAVPGQNSPQANWGLHHTRNNLSGLDGTYTPSGSGGGTLETILGELETMFQDEGDAFRTAFQQIKTEIVDCITTLTPTDVVKRLAAILADLLLTTAENLVVTAVEVIQALAQGALELLDAPIRIPVISAIYKEISGGNDLSVLDLCCLIVAIPVTVIYKLMTDEAPYPDNAPTTALIQAPSWAALQQQFGGGAAAPAALPGAMMLAADAPLAGVQAPGPLDDATITKLTSGLNIGAFFGAMGLVLVNQFKRDLGQNPGVTAPRILGTFASVLYLPYVAPNLAPALSSGSGTWYTVMNDLITSTAVAKTFADNVAENVLVDPVKSRWTRASSWVEMGINTLWLLPAIDGYVASGRKTSDALGLASNVCFDVGGMLTPATVEDNWTELPPPEREAAAAVFYGGTVAMNMAYGVLCLATGLEVGKGN